MELQDFRALSQSSFDADLCIIGTGPAGLSIAHELADTPYQVLLIESGANEPSPQLQSLDELENVGAPRQPDQSRVRTRAFGGASCVWNGRCAPLDPSDLQERRWVPLSGWPLSYAELAPYFERAASRLGLYDVAYDAALDARLPHGLPEPAAWSDALRSFCWQFSVDERDAAVAMRCARSFQRRNPRNVRVLLHATATQLHPDSSGSRIESVEIRSLSGKLGRVRARVYVVCAGGIETPRLLLASRSTVPTGLGNRYDLVGRHLMDHARSSLGWFALPQAQSLRPALSLQRIDAAGRPRYFLRGFALSSQCQEREQLLSCAGWLHETEAADDPWSALKRLARWPERRRRGTAWLPDLAALMRQPRMTFGQLHCKLVARQPVRRKLAHLELMCDVEQAPDPASRITLAASHDALGVPRARIDWRISQLQRRTLQRFGEHAVRALQRMQLPAPQLHEHIRQGQFEPSDLVDVAHPSGTTRMASDPQRGVVDAHCQVHGIDRLYIAGTAVFPTQGHANPTLTLVALAIRLADRLKAYELARATALIARDSATDSARTLAPQPSQ